MRGCERVSARARGWWLTATFGARNPVRRLVGLAACGVVSGIGEALVVVLVVGLVSRGPRSRAVPLLGALPGTWTLAAYALGLLALLALAHAGSAWLSARAARDVQQDVQGRLMTAYLDAPWSVQSVVRTGELQELVTVRTQVLAFGTQETAQALSSALNLLVVVVAAISLSPLATVGLALAVGMVIAVSVPLRRLRRAAVRASAQSQASLAVELTETALLARELRVFGVSRTAIGHLADQIEEASHRQGSVRLASAVTPPLTRDATVALLVVALAVVVSGGGVHTAVLGSTVVLVLRALAHAQSLSSFGTRWTEREDGVRRITDRLAAWRTPAACGSLSCPAVTTLALAGVAFTYPDAQAPALDGVELELRRGELVGVVGRTGGGKSTLAGVLLGLLVPDRGTVLAQGVPLEQIDPHAWHARTAWVGQEPRLLSGTVADNIRFLRDDIDDATLRRAARAAGLEEEFALEQKVGPAGVALSGGQRQRIAVARALAGAPDVVVFDEPTSALDVHTEEIVRDTLERLREERIVVVIAHRLSTVRTCDRLLVMEAGRVRVVGAPDRIDRGEEAWLREALAL